MSTSRERVRPATEHDIPALSALFKEAFNSERSERVWLWKLFANPLGSASFVCEADGRIVTHCAGTAVIFIDGPMRYRALQSVDFMSSPSYAGGLGRGGAFVRTARGFFDTYCGPGRASLVYGFPGERHRILGETLLGYRPIEPVTEWSLPVTGDGEEIVSFGRDAARDWPAARLNVGVERNAAYLAWRYADHPEHQYGIVTYRRWLRTEVRALVRKTPEALFVMELGGPINASHLAGLSRKLAALGAPVRFWGSAASPLAALLTRCGWSSQQRDHSIECRFFIDRVALARGEMYYTLGDYDVQ